MLLTQLTPPNWTVAWCKKCFSKFKTTFISINVWSIFPQYTLRLYHQIILNNLLICHFKILLCNMVSRASAGVHIFGLCVTALITDILQLSTGQHTPYWLDVCKPNLTHINISSCDEAFILEDICSGPDQNLITAGR